MLVLDADLQQTSLDMISWKKSLAHRVELLFRFLMCSWNARLWTLQEGVLARNLHLMLSDGVLGAKDLYYRSWIDIQMLYDINNETKGLLYIIAFASPEERRQGDA